MRSPASLAPCLLPNKRTGLRTVGVWEPAVGLIRESKPRCRIQSGNGGSSAATHIPSQSLRLSNCSPCLFPTSDAVSETNLISFCNSSAGGSVGSASTA